VYFQANEYSPIFRDLKAIIIKTAGVGDLIKSSLMPLIESIEYAFIYGSLARGTETGASDIDLMVIGDVRLRDIVGALSSAQKELMREVNPSIFSISDFKKRVKEGNTFVNRVLTSDKIMLVGDESEFRALG
jgi:predicted nucleotidyltransferase